MNLQDGYIVLLDLGLIDIFILSVNMFYVREITKTILEVSPKIGVVCASWAVALATVWGSNIHVFLVYFMGGMCVQCSVHHNEKCWVE